MCKMGPYDRAGRRIYAHFPSALSDFGVSKKPELRGWKEIAAYLGVTVRTAQNWERDIDLPIRRLPGGHGRVYCIVEEIDGWKSGRPDSPTVPARPTRRPRRRLILSQLAAALAGVVAIGALVHEDGPVDPPPIESAPVTASESPESHPDISADGTRVVYLAPCPQDDQHCIWVKDLDGGPGRLLAKDVGRSAFPQWSPDGERVAFLRPSSPGMDLMVAEIETGSETRFMHLPDQAREGNIIEIASFAWAAKGEGIVYSRRRDPDAPYRLVLVKNTGKQVLLTDPPQDVPGDTQPEVSPDGRYLAFTRFTTFSECDLYVRELPDGQEKRITDRNARIWGLSWVGSEGLVFASHPNRGRSQLYWTALDDDSAQPRELTGPELNTKHPSATMVGPGGHTVLAFEQKQREDNIWSVDLRTKKLQKAASSTWSESLPTCGPSEKLAYISTRTGFHEVWFHSPDHPTPTQLTELGGPYTDMPRWSPDGTKILFSSATGPTRDIFVVDLPTRSTQPFARSDTSEEGRASWSNDGKWVYFRSDRSGTPQIWKQRADGSGEARRITTGGGYEAFEAPDREFLYFVRDRESRTLWRVPVDGGSEEIVLKDGPTESLWSVSQQWVYFRDGHQLKRFALKTGAVETVYHTDETRTPIDGFAACPDRPILFWSQVDVDRADIWSARVDLP